MEALHVKEMQELSEKLRSDLEEEQRKHVTRRNTEEANPSREEENHKMESRQTTPEASEVTVVEVIALLNVSTPLDRSNSTCNCRCSREPDDAFGTTKLSSSVRFFHGDYSTTNSNGFSLSSEVHSFSYVAI